MKEYASFNQEGVASLRYTPQDGDEPKAGETIYVPSRGGNRHRCVTLTVHRSGEYLGDKWYEITVRLQIGRK